MAERSKEELERQEKFKKHLCLTKDCNNKAKRIGKKQYSNHCFKHQPVYTAGGW